MSGHVVLIVADIDREGVLREIGSQLGEKNTNPPLYSSRRRR